MRPCHPCLLCTGRGHQCALFLAMTHEGALLLAADQMLSTICYRQLHLFVTFGVLVCMSVFYYQLLFLCISLSYAASV